MKPNELVSAAEKILSTTLPKEFEFIEGVKDVIVINPGDSFYNGLKLKIILKKDWVAKNFLKDAMEYIQDDFENDGYSHLSPFTAHTYSDEKIDPSEVDSYIHNILSFLGLRTDIMNITTSYIIE